MSRQLNATPASKMTTVMAMAGASRRRKGKPFRQFSVLSMVKVFVPAAFVVSAFSHLRFLAQIRATLPGPTEADSTVIQTPSKPKEGESIVVAYAVTITGCGSDPITEGAAILKHSIHLNSVHGRGRYDYHMYAIYHPQALACAAPLASLGYTLLERETPVAVDDIAGEFLRTHIQQNGCCGEKELIKLEAYTLVDHPIVVHLDLDVLTLKPLDELFDMMIGKQGPNANDLIMWTNKPLPKTIDAFYTVDYNMVHPRTAYKPVQGGFLVTRPDMAVYEEFKDIIKKGDFRDGAGWGGKVGPFYGSMTFQGIIPYYYLVLHPGQAVELNRCIYNQMCDNPRTERTVNDVVHGACRTGQETCEDCRSRKLEDVVTTHFTLCQKPWWCLSHAEDAIQHRLCRKLTHEWYAVRSDLEKSWGRSGHGEGSWEQDHFFGYCNFSGKNGYIPLVIPSYHDK